MAETEINNRFDFLEAPEGKELFARIDFALKDGMHIQNREEKKANGIITSANTRIP